MAPSCWNRWRTLTTSLRRPSAVQNLTSTWTYRSVLIVRDRSLSSSNQNGPMMPCLEMAAQAVLFTEFPKPDIVKKVWHSVNLVAKPLAHDQSLPHVVSCKVLFNLYPVRIHVEICDQNSPHGLPVDSKLLTSLTHRLAWAVDNRVSDSSNVVWCP